MLKKGMTESGLFDNNCSAAQYQVENGEDCCFAWRE